MSESPVSEPRTASHGTPPTIEEALLRRRHMSATARRRRARKSALPQISLAIAPMVDMSFLFLIFFVATSRFQSPEGMLASALPGVSDSAVALPISPIVVRLSVIEGSRCGVAIDRFETAPLDMGALPAALQRVQRQPGFDADTPVVIVADAKLKWDLVVEAWNAALRAGCRKIAFGEP